MRTLFLLTLFLFLVNITKAQQPDTVPLPAARDSSLLKKASKMQPGQPNPSVAIVDTSSTVVLPDSSNMPRERQQGFVGRFFTKNYPNPRKAALMSVVLPGSGQIYNRKWWKVPVVYAGLGGLTWLEVRNIQNYREARDNYKWLVDGDPNTVVEPFYQGVDATSLRNYRDILRRYVEQSSLILGLAYLLTATDAFVDAHLSRFDVSEDLSLRFTPKAQATPGFGMSLGVGLNLEFGGSKNNRKFLPSQSFTIP